MAHLPSARPGPGVDLGRKAKGVGGRRCCKRRAGARMGLSRPGKVPDEGPPDYRSSRAAGSWPAPTINPPGGAKPGGFFRARPPARLAFTWVKLLKNPHGCLPLAG